MSTITLADVAEHAKVSLATVDRVMNDRPRVSERTRKRVFASAAAVGYIEAQETIVNPVRLAFVLPEGTNSFIHELVRHIHEQGALMELVTVSVEFVTGFDPEALAKTINSLEDQVDGMAIMAVDHPIVRESLRGLVTRGMAVTTLGTDIRTVGHLGYIGIDDTQAGRLAGYLIGKLGCHSGGKVAFFSGSLAYRGHQERELGFRQILHEEFLDLVIVEQREVHDDRAKAQLEMIDILKKHPDLKAIYNAGGGTAGIAAALEKSGRAADIIFIAHDVTAENKSFLLHGTLDAVVDQNARLEVAEALRTLVHAVRGTAYRMVSPRLQIIFRENLPNE